MHVFLEKAISWIGYLHLGSILSWIASLYTVIKKQKCKLVYPLWIMCRILDNMFFWTIIYIRAATERIQIFFYIKRFFLQFILIGWKIVLPIIIIQILHFWINVACFIHICVVRRLTAQIEISNQQMIFIIHMLVLWQVKSINYQTIHNLSHIDSNWLINQELKNV